MIDISAVGSIPLHQIEAKSDTNGHFQLPFPHTPPPPSLPPRTRWQALQLHVDLNKTIAKIRTTKTTKTKQKIQKITNRGYKYSRSFFFPSLLGKCKCSFRDSQHKRHRSHTAHCNTCLDLEG